jgi:hypothetical protein
MQSQEDRYSYRSFPPDRNVWPPDLGNFAFLLKNERTGIYPFLDLGYDPHPIEEHRDAAALSTGLSERDCPDFCVNKNGTVPFAALNRRNSP